MFDFVRKHTKIMMSLMFLLIIPAFVLVGINGFRSINGGGETVAKIGGQSIKQEEWDAAHKNDVDRLRASSPNVDVKMFDSPLAKYVTLEKLVHERVIAQAALDNRLATTDVRLARELQQNPTIASLRRADGSMDMDRYRALAAAQGLTPEGFEARVRTDLTARQVEGAILTSALSPANQAKVSLDAFFERREVQIATFTPADYANKFSPSEADVEAFYKANLPLFQAPETANIEYLLLDLDAVKKSITINDADVKSYYEQNVARLSGKEERRASHILIAAGKDLPAAKRDDAKKRALALLEQVRKAPDSFADAARKNSQDPGSAAKGGDLDFFGRGAMVKPFEDAVFSMKKGDISDVVESDFGYHVIKLTDVKAPKEKSFEELRPGIEQELRTQQSQHKFAEVAEIFTNGVYEQSDSLKPMADKLKLEIKTATNVQRTPQSATTGPLASSKLLTAIFSTDSIDKKRNTEAIEIGPNQMVSARITSYSPAHTLSLQEVRADATAKLVANRTLALAKADGVAKLTLWKSKPDAADMKPAVLVSRDQSQGLAPAILTEAMRLDPQTLPAFVGVDMGSNGYVVVRVNKVLERADPKPETAKQESRQYAQWMANAEAMAYYEFLKAQYKVQIKVAKPPTAVESGKAVAE
jgi:peptidyl-prolyl cis-trans isomerase D